MKLNEKRMIEYVLLVLFPAALFAGCAGNGNEKTQTLTENQVNETQIEQVSYAVATIDENETVQRVVINSNENERVDVSITPMPNIAKEETQEENLERTVYFGTNIYSVRVGDEVLLV